jgi:hypothetical protein
MVNDLVLYREYASIQRDTSLLIDSTEKDVTRLNGLYYDTSKVDSLMILWPRDGGRIAQLAVIAQQP